MHPSPQSLYIIINYSYPAPKKKKFIRVLAAMVKNVAVVTQDLGTKFHLCQSLFSLCMKESFCFLFFFLMFFLFLFFFNVEGRGYENRLKHYV